jgi:hypothetical protein
VRRALNTPPKPHKRPRSETAKISKKRTPKPKSK